MERQDTVLVVEDEAMLRELIKESLELYGFKVLMASGGNDALKLAGDYPDRIDILVTDVALPGMSGREVARAIEKIRPEIRILYISGHIEAAIAHHGIPASAFLQKPFLPQELARKLRELLEK